MTRLRPLPLALVIVLALWPTPGALSEEPATAPPVTLRDLSWIAGSWAASVGEGSAEETWLAPAGGAMVGVFRWLRDGKVYLYELMTIEDGGRAPVLKIKHFGADLVGWEEKTDAVTLELVEAGEGYAAFAETGDEEEGTRLVYRREDGGLTVTFAETRGGNPVEVVFRYARR